MMHNNEVRSRLFFRNFGKTIIFANIQVSHFREYLVRLSRRLDVKNPKLGGPAALLWLLAAVPTLSFWILENKFICFVISNVEFSAETTVENPQEGVYWTTLKAVWAPNVRGWWSEQILFPHRCNFLWKRTFEFGLHLSSPCDISLQW